MTAGTKPIQTAKFAQRLRERSVRKDAGKLLISRLSASDQEQDLTAPTNCGGLGRVRHFRRDTSTGWPENPLPIDPALRALNLPRSNALTAQVFQNGACAWRCWYCYVPDALLKGSERHGEWVEPDELIRRYALEPDRPSVIDLSGGSPDLVPEWVPQTMRSLRERGLESETYLWSDDNLSTDYLFDKLSDSDWALMRSYANYGRVCCFKGFDIQSFAFNTRAAESDYAFQFERMDRLLSCELDVYAYATFTSPNEKSVRAGVVSFVDRLQELHPNLPLRTVPLEIQMFSPTQQRTDAVKVRSCEVQQAAIEVWMEELEKRFDTSMRSLSVVDVNIQR